jgi:hypothetical protein
VTTVDANTIDAAIKASKLPVLLVFFMPGSVLSARMVKRVGELDPTKITVLLVDVNASSDLVRRFSIRKVPHLLKIDATGNLIAAGDVLSEVIVAE